MFSSSLESPCQGLSNDMLSVKWCLVMVFPAPALGAPLVARCQGLTLEERRKKKKKERIRILRGLRNQVPPSRPSRATGAALDHVAAFLFRTRPAEAEFITREQSSRFVPFFDCKYNLSKFLQCPESGNLPQPTPPNRDAWVSHSA